MTRPLRYFIPVSLILTGIICYAQDLTLSQQEIVEKAEGGNASYQAALGERYRLGEYSAKNPGEAFSWLKEAAEGGSPVGKYGLGRLYLSGEGTNQDSAAGLKLISEALPELLKQSESGNTLAQLSLADIYHDGLGVPQDYAEAKKWYARAVKNGNPRAQNALGVMYIYGEGTEPYPETATLWFRRASLQNYVPAMYNYAICYETGHGIKHIMKYAVEWYQKAADAGHPGAQARLGKLYLTGNGVDQDYGRAIELFKKAGEKGEPSACFQLGNLYLNGFGIQKDVDQAQSWFARGSIPLDQFDLNAVQNDSDRIIPDYPPPADAMNIPGGSCGEMILWTLLHHRGDKQTQLEINQEAGFPGRGIHSPELGNLLVHYGFKVDDQMNLSVLSYAAAFFNPYNWLDDKVEKDKAILEDKIIPAVKAGFPVILGVKIYPDQHWMWPMDHFILLVGYNEKTGELIYNSNNSRSRIKVDDLLNREDYSVINRYRYVPYIVIENN